MMNRCATCNQPIEEGDRVTVFVTATYHALKSKVAYALDKSDMEAEAETLAHVRCPIEY